MKNVGFEYIAGYREEVKELVNLSKILKKRDELFNGGYRFPRGLLLIGDAGVGKSFMAESLIAESNINCIRIDVDMAEDECSHYLDEKFNEAVNNAPSILFIDELDKMCGENVFMGTGSEVDKTRKFIKAINDHQSNDVMIIATANDGDMLADSLVRSGRFDRIINIPLPSFEDRKEIIDFYIKDKKIDKKVKVENIAKMTGSFSGADIECLINEAGINATIEERDSITIKDIEKAINRIVFHSCEKDNVLDKFNKEIVAIHEVGHLIAGLILDKDNISGVSIIPQGSSKGHTKINSISINTCREQDIINKVVISLAGRAAEKVYMPEEQFLGSEFDIEKAYVIVKHLLCDSCFYGFEYHASQCGHGEYMSEQRIERIEKKTDELVREYMIEAENIIRMNKELADKYIAEVKRKLSLTREEIMKIYNKHNKDNCDKTVSTK